MKWLVSYVGLVLVLGAVLPAGAEDASDIAADPLDIVGMLGNVADERASRVETLRATYDWIDRVGLDERSRRPVAHRVIRFIKSGRKIRCDTEVAMGSSGEALQTMRVEVFDGENSLEYSPDLGTAMYREKLSLNFSPLQFGVSTSATRPLSWIMNRIVEMTKTGEAHDFSVTGPFPKDGSDHYSITYAFQNDVGHGRAKLIIDAERALVRLYEHHDEGRNTKAITEIMKVREVDQGIWCPTEVRTTLISLGSTDSGEPVPTEILERTVVARTIEVNVPIENSVFRIALPPGTVVGSDITGGGFRLPATEQFTEDMGSSEILPPGAAAKAQGSGAETLPGLHPPPPSGRDIVAPEATHDGGRELGRGVIAGVAAATVVGLLAICLLAFRRAYRTRRCTQ